MSQLAEVELVNELDTLRHCVSGQTFAEAPETFKDIESTKVRLNVLRDPDHYAKLQGRVGCEASACAARGAVMRAHTPPFTKPEAAYDSRRLYEETSAIAAEQDAKLDPISDTESKARTAMQYLHHAQNLLKEAFPDPIQRAPKWSPQWLADHNIPAESSYLASFSPNDMQAETLREYGIGDVARHPMHAEAIRDHDERLNGPEDVL